MAAAAAVPRSGTLVWLGMLGTEGPGFSRASLHPSPPSVFGSLQLQAGKATGNSGLQVLTRLTCSGPGPERA